jgi:hypothetical protein
LDDVIERIEKLRLDEKSTPSQLTEQSRPSHKFPPKWLTKTLESVHPDEVRKTGTKMSSRQDGGNVDNSNSCDVDDMDVSHDCELNLSTNLEQLPLKKLLLMMNGKKPCRRNMMLSSRMGHGNWWTLHMEPNRLAASGYSRTNIDQMGHLTSTKQGLWKKDLHRKKVLIMRRLLPPQQNGLPFVIYLPWQHRTGGKFIKWM